MKPGELYYTLSDVVMVDAKKFKKLSADDLAKYFKEINEKGFPVVFNETIERLFDKKALVDNIVKGKDVKHMLEVQEITMNDTETAAIAGFRLFLDRLMNKPVDLSNYVCVDVPENFNIKNYFEISPGSIERRRNSYRLHTETAERLWVLLRNAWAKGGTSRFRRSLDGNKHTVVVSETGCTIGCQDFHRYEIEQLAKHMNWPFA